MNPVHVLVVTLVLTTLTGPDVRADVASVTTESSSVRSSLEPVLLKLTKLTEGEREALSAKFQSSAISSRLESVWCTLPESERQDLSGRVAQTLDDSVRQGLSSGVAIERIFVIVTELLDRDSPLRQDLRDGERQIRHARKSLQSQLRMVERRARHALKAAVAARPGDNFGRATERWIRRGLRELFD